MKEYNGHRSWNAWNVNLWLSNEEWVEYSVIRPARDRGDSIAKITNKLYNELKGTKTPDGAVYNKMSIRSFVEGALE